MARKNTPLIEQEIGIRIWHNILKYKQGHEKKQYLRHYAMIAACITALIIIGGLTFYFQNDSNYYAKPEYIEITASNNMYYQLPDSSKVWLQPKSSIRFAKNFNKDRKVWLSGNSLFEVSKHQGKTFRVYIEKAFIEVKGTRFLVEKNKDGNEEITLFNGCIEFNIESVGKQINMNPLDRIKYNPINESIQFSRINNMEWNGDKFKFNAMPLQDLIYLLNKMYCTDIVFKGQDIHSTYSGTIRKEETLDEVINKICFIKNLTKTEENNHIVLSN
jgi:Fe2+-dicitrate sensor, membrane component